MSIKAWPFLISRNKVLDYSVIVAPDCISKNDFSHLVSLTSGDVTDSDETMRRTMSDANGQTLTLVFRIEQAQIDHHDVRDGFGRLIVWVVGIILEGSEKRGSSVAEEVFQAVHNSVDQSYREFWNQSEHTSVVPSDALYLCFGSGSPQLTLSSSKEPQVISRSPAPKETPKFKITEFLAMLKAKFVTFFGSR
jgi:hypothetical protein